MSNRFGIADLSLSLLNYFNGKGQLQRFVQLGFPDQNAPQETTLLYLYKIEVDEHYKNHVHGYTESKPPVPIRLHYILMFNFQNEIDAQQELASLIYLLHSRPVLPKEYAETGLGALVDQADPIRLKTEDLSLEDLTKLWTSFQSRYRLSLPFTASVLMLDIEEKPADAMPILRRPIPGENIVVNPYLSTRLLDVYGQLDGTELVSNSRLSNISVGHKIVFNVTGGISSIEGFEFTPTSTELSDSQRKLHTVTIPLDESTEKVGQLVRLTIPRDLSGNSKWHSDRYQVRAIITNPFTKKDNAQDEQPASSVVLSSAESAPDKPPHFSPPILIGMAPTLELVSPIIPDPQNPDRRVYAIVDSFGLMTVRLLQDLIFDESTGLRIYKQRPKAILTQWKSEGESWDGATPKRFEIEADIVSESVLQFRLAGIGPLAGEKYVLRIKIDDLVSHHYKFEPKKNGFAIDEKAVVAPAGGVQ